MNVKTTTLRALTRTESTAQLFSPHPRSLTPIETATAFTFCGIGIVAALLTSDSSIHRSFVALGAGLALGLLSWRDPVRGIAAIAGWLIFLGFTRRVVSEFQIDTANDPLLAASVIGSAPLFVRAIADGCLRSLTNLAWLVLIFLTLIFVTMANPAGHSAKSAVAGALFWGLPMLYFFVGRRLNERGARLVMWVAFSTIVASAIYAAGQVFIGFPHWDGKWIEAKLFGDESRQMLSLVVADGTIRPFGFASSATGFATAVGTVVLSTAAVAVTTWRNGRRYVAAALAATSLFCLTMLVLNAVRTVLFVVLVATFIVVSAAVGGRLVRWAIMAAACFLLLGLALSFVNPDSLSREGPGGMVRRVVIGLGHPFDDTRENTGSTHINLAKEGFQIAWHEPLGRGPGSTGLVGLRLGEGVDTEKDLSNAAVAFGLPGAMIAILTLALGLFTLYSVAHQRRDAVALAALSVALASLSSWWNTAHWAMAPLLWLAIGWADGTREQLHFRSSVDA